MYRFLSNASGRDWMNRPVVRSEFHEPDVCCAGRICRRGRDWTELQPIRAAKLVTCFLKLKTGDAPSVRRLIRSALY